MDLNEDKVLARFASMAGTPVYRFAILPDFEVFIYTKFDGQRVRDFYVHEGELMCDEGSSTPEEQGFTLNERINADGLEGMLLGLGVDLAAIEPPYLSKRFERIG